MGLLSGDEDRPGPSGCGQRRRANFKAVNTINFYGGNISVKNINSSTAYKVQECRHPNKPGPSRTFARQGNANRSAAGTASVREGQDASIDGIKSASLGTDGHSPSGEHTEMTNVGQAKRRRPPEVQSLGDIAASTRITSNTTRKQSVLKNLRTKAPAFMMPLEKAYRHLGSAIDEVTHEREPTLPRGETMYSTHSFKVQIVDDNPLFLGENWCTLPCMDDEDASEENGDSTSDSGLDTPCEVSCIQFPTWKSLAVKGEKSQTGMILKNRMHLLPCVCLHLPSDAQTPMDFRRTSFSLGKNQGVMYTGDEDGNLEHAVRWMRYFFAFLGACEEVFGLKGNPFSFQNLPFVYGSRECSWEGLVRQLMAIVGIKNNGTSREEMKIVSHALDRDLNRVLLKREQEEIRQELVVLNSIYRTLARHSRCTMDQMIARVKIFFEEGKVQNLDSWVAFIPHWEREEVYRRSGLSRRYFDICAPRGWEGRTSATMKVKNLPMTLSNSESNPSNRGAGQLMYMLPSFHRMRDETLGDAVSRWKSFQWGILGLIKSLKDKPCPKKVHRSSGPATEQSQQSSRLLVALGADR